MTRKIIHIDMDAFYASIEQRDHPEWRGKPVVVGGNPNTRGVVCAASYEARKFGVRSAMASINAYRCCPHAIFARPRFEVYKQVSAHLHRIFAQYTDLIEPLALDEAYLDVTHNKVAEPSATRLAQKIIDQIYQETGLTASAGVSFNKFLAKTASGWQKPHGLTVITPEKAPAFIEELPIGRFYGVGKATERKMLALGIHYGRDLKEFSLDRLRLRFGKMGVFFYQLAHCQDNRAVNPSRVRKSLGKETTFDKDISGLDQLQTIMREICEEVHEDLTKRNLRGRTLTVKVRYADFHTVSRSRTEAAPFSSAEDMFQVALQLMEAAVIDGMPVRLIGASVSTFGTLRYVPMSLFDRIKALN